MDWEGASQSPGSAVSENEQAKKYMRPSSRATPGHNNIYSQDMQSQCLRDANCDGWPGG